jgi:outer membrane immunogenic protein
MKMRLAIAALLLSSVPAMAADLAEQPVEPVAPIVLPFSWTGFYVGAHVGYAGGSENDNLSVVPLPTTPILTGPPADHFDVNGIIGGIHAGYNEQFENNIVVGVEGDIDAAGINGDQAVFDPINGSSRLSMRSNWQGSLRARFGYAFDHILVYATGGVAFANVREKWNLFDGTFFGSKSKTRVGWTAGGGVEYAFDDHWSARVEVRYSDFGKSSYVVSPTAAFKGGFHETAGLVGVSYKF